MNKTDQTLLMTVADMKEMPGGAYNIRKNGAGVERHSTENIIIETKKDNPGIDIIIKPFTKGETVHIPVIITETGIDDLVYNDFYIGEGADVSIIAGCGIHNCGSETSQHNGIHTFHVGKNAKIRYTEKHYGEGDGSGENIMNPKTIVEMDEGSYCEMDMVQIKGIDSTKRDTTANLKKDARLIINEKLMTHGKQEARSDTIVYLNEEDASARIVSRSVAKDDSEQIFYPRAIGNAQCRAHIQCDSIIMDHSKVRSIPEIEANDADAQIVHEAAIGRINSDQLMKLQTLGLDEEEAEAVIVEGFLS